MKCKLMTLIAFSRLHQKYRIVKKCEQSDKDWCFVCQMGEITEVRLVKNFKGKSKGFAYVEFKDEVRVILYITRVYVLYSRCVGVCKSPTCKHD